MLLAKFAESRRIYEQLKERFERNAGLEQPAPEVDEEIMRQLRALGYVE